ncbi:MAG: MFS transporter [Phycisphaerales bacterium]|nr:MFS transporter [Phycisphaerales bacterium]
MIKRPAWLTKEVVGWTMFDFANQAFTMVIITALYQQYFIKQVVPMVGESDHHGKRLWEISNISAELVIIAISPLLGALADFSGAKKKFLFITYMGCVLATLGLGLVGPGDVALGMTLFIIGYIFFGAGENFLNAFLPEIAEHRDMGRVSAFSWAIAYTGALLSTAVAYGIIGWLGKGPAGNRTVAVWCGVYFLLGGIPTFILLTERKLKEQLPPGQTIFTVGFHRLAQTFKDIRRFRQLMRFLVIVMIYMAGMQVVIFYAGSIANDVFKFTTSQQGIFFAQVIITGIIGAAITGRVQDRIGTRTTILGLLVIWSLTMFLAGFATRQAVFWVLGNFVGFSMGALGSASRVMAGLFSPQYKAGEFFGFYGMAQKLAVILGLGFQFLLGTMGVAFNWAIAASSVFFIAGFFLMFWIDEREGRIAAIRAAREHIRKHRDYKGELPSDPVAPNG